MDIEGQEESTNVEDRRGMGMKAGMVGGAGGIVIIILGLIFNVDLTKFLGNGGPQQGGQQQIDPAHDPDAKTKHFVSVVFGDTEVVWKEQFKKMGKTYQKPVLVLFTDNVSTACGAADSGVGPFYCPGDSKVYIDMAFYKVMERKLNAPGDFARAYVIAHEVGHHVQHLLGYPRLADKARGRENDVEAHHQSVRLELQADYFAGVWAHDGQERFHFLQPGDIESALNAANQIGDDKLQSKAGHVRPDTFTHGTSKQRMYWFKKGFDTGDVAGAAALFDLPYDRL